MNTLESAPPVEDKSEIREIQLPSRVGKVGRFLVGTLDGKKYVAPQTKSPDTKEAKRRAMINYYQEKKGIKN